jgi:hypothetical protein
VRPARQGAGWLDALIRPLNKSDHLVRSSELELEMLVPSKDLKKIRLLAS